MQWDYDGQWSCNPEGGEEGFFFFFSYPLSCLSVMKDLLCLSYSISASLAAVNNQSVAYLSCVLKVSG